MFLGMISVCEVSTFVGDSGGCGVKDEVGIHGVQTSMRVDVFRLRGFAACCIC